MRALEIITSHVIYNPAYTYKFQLKTTIIGIQKHAGKVRKVILLCPFDQREWTCSFTFTRYDKPFKSTPFFPDKLYIVLSAIKNEDQDLKATFDKGLELITQEI